MSNINPYLFFNGRCEEALQFYQKAIGLQIDILMRYKESPEPHQPGMVPAGWDEKVMHASTRVGLSVLMMSDGNCEGGGGFEGFSISFNAANEEEAERAFAALGEGGKVNMPLTKTFWSPKFGMVEDRFGLSWMVSVMH